MPLREGTPNPHRAETRPLAFTRAEEANWARGRDLNPRPPGYEPGKLPDCSTPLHASHITWDGLQRPASTCREGTPANDHRNHLRGQGGAFTTPFVCKLTPDTYQRLRRVAAAGDVSAAALVRVLIEEGLDRFERQPDHIQPMHKLLLGVKA
jgi:hypothetical protein